jgi:hypothetical protein
VCASFVSCTCEHGVYLWPCRFQELVQCQVKLVSKINSMQERIAEKDAIIDKLRSRGATRSKEDAGPQEDDPLTAELEERDALTNELSLLKLQMFDTQNTMETAMETGKVLAGQFDETHHGRLRDDVDLGHKGSGVPSAGERGRQSGSAAAADAAETRRGALSSTNTSHEELYATASSTSVTADVARPRSGDGIGAHHSMHGSAAASSSSSRSTGGVLKTKEQGDAVKNTRDLSRRSGQVAAAEVRGSDPPADSTEPAAAAAEASSRAATKVMLWKQVADSSTPDAS